MSHIINSKFTYSKLTDTTGNKLKTDYEFFSLKVSGYSASFGEGSMFLENMSLSEKTLDMRRRNRK